MKWLTLHRTDGSISTRLFSQDMLDKLNLDVDEIVNMKMEQNEAKYPVEKAKGSAKKYIDL